MWPAIAILYGLSPLKNIYKDFLFQFQVDFTFSKVKVKNV